jgi:hypothetical protein
MHLRLVACGLLLSACAAIAGCRGEGDAMQTVKGTVVLSGLTVGRDGTACDGTDKGAGYGDLVEGASIVVANESGDTIATARLGAGRRYFEGENATPSNGFKDTRDFFCSMAFEVSVPDARFYGFEIAARESVQYSAQELKDMNGEVTLSI